MTTVERGWSVPYGIVWILLLYCIDDSRHSIHEWEVGAWYIILRLNLKIQMPLSPLYSCRYDEVAHYNTVFHVFLVSLHGD